MTFSDQTKREISFKKLVGRDHTSNTKEFFEEIVGGGFNVHASEVWSDTIPTIAPGYTTEEVQYFDDFALTEDTTVDNEQGWEALQSGVRLRGWVPSKFGQDYIIRLFSDDGYGNKGEEIASSDPINWFFDYETGFVAVENILTTNRPAPALPDIITPLHIQGYYYIGNTVDVTAGVDGATGPAGADGTVGATGPSGGPIGETGAIGATGPQGTQGTQGLTGETGVEGVIGVTGPQGTQGTQGLTGETGVEGSQGTQGLTGETGVEGAIGVTGPQGTQGTQGFTGETGVEGVIGATGPGVDPAHTHVAADITDKTIGDIVSTETLSGVWTVGTNVKIQFRDTGIFIHSDSDGSLVIESDVNLDVHGNTATTIGKVAGDIVLGGSSGVTMYPNTTLKVNLGSTTNVFNEGWVNEMHVQQSVADVSSPPLDAELDSEFGTPATLGRGFVGTIDDNDANTTVWVCITTDAGWFTIATVKAI